MDEVAGLANPRRRHLPVAPRRAATSYRAGLERLAILAILSASFRVVYLPSERTGEGAE